MASGGSSSRPPSVSRSFDFGSDDVLCSYDDLGSQDSSNGKRSESAGKNPKLPVWDYSPYEEASKLPGVLLLGLLWALSGQAFLGRPRALSVGKLA
ncbi:hypothetical protein Taro_027225 [Colocasia esculenta]|uniref:Uncharacterized protein n=1 Tax=Colocasia esculenta TaxID=4460 RepID=A0A843VJI8_COLES|nr:hypothetical protein [Colocasia esculenta]